MKRSKIVVASISLTVGVMTLSVLAIGASSGSIATSRAPVEVSRVSDSGASPVARRIVSKFKIFGSEVNAKVASVSQAALVSKVVPEMLRSPFMVGAQASNARVVSVSPSIGIVVLAGPNGVCVGGSEPAASSGKLARLTIYTGDCNSVQAAVTGGVGNVSEDSRGGSNVAFGLVPNGYAAVAFQTAAGIATVPVTDNVYYASGLVGYRGKPTFEK